LDRRPRRPGQRSGSWIAGGADFRLAGRRRAALPDTGVPVSGPDPARGGGRSPRRRGPGHFHRPASPSGPAWRVEGQGQRGAMRRGPPSVSPRPPPRPPPPRRRAPQRFTPAGAAAERNGHARLLAAEPLTAALGLDIAMSALAEIPGAELVIGGGPHPDEAGRHQAYRDLRRTARKLGVHDRLVF